MAPSLPSALLPDAPRRFRLRVLVAPQRRAQVLLPPDATDAMGTPRTPTLDAPLDTGARGPRALQDYVVVEAGPSLRLIDEYRDVRVLLYVDPRDALGVATRGAELLPEPGRTGMNTAGLTVYPGLPLHVLERQGEHTHVRIDDAGLRADGWLPTDVVGTVFEPRPMPAPAGALVSLRGGAALLETPGGRAVAHFTPDAVLAATRLAPPVSGFVNVLVQQGTQLRTAAAPSVLYEARGFVAEADVGSPAGETGWGAGAPAFEGGGDSSRLPRGTRLHDRPSGEVVGLAIEDSSAWLDPPRPDGWQRASIRTHFGPIETWIRGRPGSMP